MGSDFWGSPAAPLRVDKPSSPPPSDNSSAPGSAASTGNDDTQAPAAEVAPPEKIEDLEAELEGYIGLTAIKREVKNLINLVTVYKLRREHELPTTDLSLHMVFSGNPGTGKTTVARLMARIYHALGILSKGQLVEVDRSGLVAGYVGQTALKTSKVIDTAIGGVLFIDEAYALNGRAENDFGQEAIDTILKAMEDHRDDLVVIVAGYDGLMEDFIHSNPGLESRFNRYLHFDDYTAEEMMAIFRSQCKRGCYELSSDAEAEVRKFLEEANTNSISFGNARGVRNIFEQILVNQANRLAAQDDVCREDLMRITLADVRAAQGKTPQENEIERAAEIPEEPRPDSEVPPA
jgi:stage V sporulation protein K